MTVVLSGPGPRVTLVDGRPRTDRSDGGSGVGSGGVYRDETRREAMRWLRELNAAPADEPDGLSRDIAWSRDLA